MHPYEMYQLLIQRREDWIVKVRPGSLYHTVDRMAEQKLVRSAGTDRDGNRPERTIYDITATGRDALTARVTELLANPIREYPLFPLALAEAHNLPADTAVTLLRQRVAALDTEIAELDAMAEFVRSDNVPRVYWLNIEYARTVVAAQVDWLRQLIDQIVDGSLPWQCIKINHSAESRLT
ncbi:PadR family transcriptional regulator [Antrihabitans cavernicola]|uniref:PadR family transcriptional regulator n=2 Tax=Antrihabitans cavernicola TaxID=2495913 RepID=A0A5A7S9D9_9NOCA|nr:PadR family transcriptional regulator [Spelaeibacter cavernicola]